MEKKKSNKGLIITIVILIILLLGLAGYICYDKYKVKTLPSVDKKAVSTVDNNDFYSIDNLVKNHYIKKLNSTSSNGAIEIRNGSIYYANTDNAKLVKDTTIKEEPISVHSIRYGGPAAPLSLYVLTKDNNLYYRVQDTYDENDEVLESNVNTFTKINPKKVVNVYTGYLERLSDDFIGVDYGDGNLYIHSSIGFTTTYKDYIDYPDYQVAYATGDGILWRISKDKKLYAYVSNDEESSNGSYKEVTYKEKPVIIKNTFNGILNDEIVNFVIDSNDNLLNLQFGSKDKTNLSLYKNSKVKDIKYEKDKEGDYSVKVTLEDGNSFNISKAQLSSLYLRNNS